MTSWNISGIRFSVEYAWSINAYTLLLVSLHLSVSLLLFSGFTKHISETRCPLLSHYVSSLLSHIRPPTHTHIHAVWPKHFQTHDCVCGDIHCICHASYIFKWNDSIYHQKIFCSECGNMILHTLCSTLPLFPLLYRIWKYAVCISKYIKQ